MKQACEGTLYQITEDGFQTFLRTVPNELQLMVPTRDVIRMVFKPNR